MKNNEIVLFDSTKDGEVVYTDFAYITRYGSLPVAVMKYLV